MLPRVVVCFAVFVVVEVVVDVACCVVAFVVAFVVVVVFVVLVVVLATTCFVVTLFNTSFGPLSSPTVWDPLGFALADELSSMWYHLLNGIVKSLLLNYNSSKI